MYSGYFDNFPEDLLQDILDMGNPDKMTMNNSEELAAKQVIENMAFKEDQYMFDYIDLDGTIKDLIEKEPPFPGYSIHDVTFSEKESELMLELTRKSFEGLCTQDMVLYLTLVDIVLAYCYNFRMNDGENTVESSWLISKLSASLSCLIQFETLQQVIESFLRRSLCYPLYRNFSFSQKVMKDAARILSLGGKKVLMKIFLDLKVLFDKDEHRHIFSKLFLNDYCIWISKDSLNKTFHQLGRQLDILKICKKDLDWNLEEYEKLSEETTLEDSESRELPCEAL